jgi:hypothetical protein
MIPRAICENHLRLGPKGAPVPAPAKNGFLETLKSWFGGE